MSPGGPPRGSYAARVSTAASSPPVTFTVALESLREVRYRPELSVDEAPAPQRLAPHSVALTADLFDDSDEEVATARLVLLHDPDGVESWEGDFRVVTFVRSDLEADVAGDPMLAEVAWTWLVEALADHGADHRALGGTVTRVSSVTFGVLDGQAPRSQVEIRASWTPTVPPDRLGDHARAWGALIEQAAGLVPTPRGVASLGQRHRT